MAYRKSNKPTALKYHVLYILVFTLKLPARRSKCRKLSDALLSASKYRGAVPMEIIQKDRDVDAQLRIFSEVPYNCNAFVMEKFS